MNNTMLYYKRALGAFIGRGMYCGNLEELFRKIVFKSDKEPRCFYCGAALTFENFAADHYDPLNNGGAHSLDNLRASCRTCNLKKHAKVPLDVEPRAGEKTERGFVVSGGLTSPFVRREYFGKLNDTAYIFRGFVPSAVDLYRKTPGLRFVSLHRGYAAIIVFESHLEEQVEQFFKSLGAEIYGTR